MAKKQSVTAEYQGDISQDDKGKWWLAGGISPVGTVLYPFCFAPGITFQGRDKQKKGEALTEKDREYSCQLLFEKSDPVLKSLEKKINELGKKGLGLKTGQTFRSPIKDGAEQFAKDPEKYKIYKGKKYITLKRPSKLEAPTVLDESGAEMLSKEDLYSGCFAVAQVSFKTYDAFGGGVTAYWSAIKKVGDGEKIGPNRDQIVAKQLNSQSDGVQIVDGKVVYS